MSKTEFKKRVESKFPLASIRYETNELTSIAHVTENDAYIMFYNNVYSDYIYIQWHNKDCGIADF